MPRKRKEYTVTGTQPVLGNHPGTTFEAYPTEVAFALSIGAVSETKPKGK